MTFSMSCRVLYTVCDAIRLDASDYSFAYVARWSGGDLDRIQEAAERVMCCARQILVALQATSAVKVE